MIASVHDAFFHGYHSYRLLGLLYLALGRAHSQCDKPHIRIGMMCFVERGISWVRKMVATMSATEYACNQQNIHSRGFIFFLFVAGAGGGVISCEVEIFIIVFPSCSPPYVLNSVPQVLHNVPNSTYGYRWVSQFIRFFDMNIQSPESRVLILLLIIKDIHKVMPCFIPCLTTFYLLFHA
jgi:hypothetical protein